LLRLMFQSGRAGLAVRIFVVCLLMGLVLVLLIGLLCAECLPSRLTEKQITLNDSMMTIEMISILMLFYGIGLFASLYLDIGRLNRQDYTG